MVSWRLSDMKWRHCVPRECLPGEHLFCYKRPDVIWVGKWEKSLLCCSSDFVVSIAWNLKDTSNLFLLLHFKICILIPEEKIYFTDRICCQCQFLPCNRVLGLFFCPGILESMVHVVTRGHAYTLVWAKENYRELDRGVFKETNALK